MSVNDHKLFVRTVYWENWCHCHLLKITTYANRNASNRVREYVWAHPYGNKPEYGEIAIYYRDDDLRYRYVIRKYRKVIAE